MTPVMLLWLVAFLVAVPLASIFCLLLSGLHMGCVNRAGNLVQNYLIAIRPSAHEGRFWLNVEDGYRSVSAYVCARPELEGGPSSAVQVGTKVIEIEKKMWRQLKWLAGSHALAWLACQHGKTLSLQEAADVTPALRNLLRHQILAACRGNAANGDGLRWLRKFKIDALNWADADRLRLPVLTNGSVAFTELVEHSGKVRWTPRLAFSGVVPIQLVSRPTDVESSGKLAATLVLDNIRRIPVWRAVVDWSVVVWQLAMHTGSASSLSTASLG
eukprot:c1185_g1_i2.p2 GENE.c1185_g1_i2~~c1185_g1_i2.p2  ORF type:complete len:272 (+),score=43.70 c1185_g1_i2:1006-1821(+)